MKKETDSLTGDKKGAKIIAALRKERDRCKTVKSIAKLMCKSVRIKLPEDICPQCKKKKLVRFISMFSGPYGGTIVCENKKCAYRESSISYLGKKMISVEPLSPNDPRYIEFMKKGENNV